MTSSTEETKFKVLFLDTDNYFVNKLSAQFDTKKHPSLELNFVQNLQDAESLLKDSSSVIHSVFINPIAYGLSAFRAISLTHRLKPVTPIYLLCDGALPFSESELPRLMIYSVLQKSQMLSVCDQLFTRLIHPHSISYLRKQSRFANSNKSQDDSLPQNDQGYTRVSASDFLNAVNIPFDIHFQDENKQFKLLSESRDRFTFDRIRIYLDRGVQYFYINKQSHERLVNYCELFSQTLLKRNDISNDLRIIETLYLGQDISNQISVHSIVAEHLEKVEEFGYSVQELIPILTKHNGYLLKKFLNHSRIYDRAIQSTVIAILLSIALKMQSTSIQKLISVACFFHDLGLMSLPQEIQSIRESEMSPPQLQIYKTHPRLSVERLTSITKVEETIIQAILQHHERYDHSGFPGIVRGNSINQIAQIIGLSDELVHLLEDVAQFPELNFGQELTTRIFRKFSPQLIDAFKTAFSGFVS